MVKQFNEEILLQGKPFPPVKHILPRLIVCWNLMKGGVDEYSRTLKNQKAMFRSLHPYAFIIIRTIMSMFYNIHHIRRLLAIEDRLNAGVIKNRDQLDSTLQHIGSFANSLSYIATTLENATELPVEAVQDNVQSNRDRDPLYNKLTQNSKNYTKVDFLNSNEGKCLRFRHTMHRPVNRDPGAGKTCVLCGKKTEVWNCFIVCHIIELFIIYYYYFYFIDVVLGLCA